MMNKRGINIKSMEQLSAEYENIINLCRKKYTVLIVSKNIDLFKIGQIEDKVWMRMVGGGRELFFHNGGKLFIFNYIPSPYCHIKYDYCYLDSPIKDEEECYGN